jgi:hypothetical protein
VATGVVFVVIPNWACCEEVCRLELRFEFLSMYCTGTGLRVSHGVTAGQRVWVCAGLRGIVSYDKQGAQGSALASCFAGKRTGLFQGGLPSVVKRRHPDSGTVTEDD